MLSQANLTFVYARSLFSPSSWQISDSTTLATSSTHFDEQKSLIGFPRQMKLSKREFRSLWITNRLFRILLAVASWSAMWFSFRTRLISRQTFSIDRSKAKPVRLRMRNNVSGRSPSLMSCNISFCFRVSSANSFMPFFWSAMTCSMIALNHRKSATIMSALSTRKKAAVTAIIP